MSKTPINPIPVTILAAGALVWAFIVVGIAAVGPSGLVPQVFHSLRLEHFLGFYGLGLLSVAALPNVKLQWISAALAAAATLFGLVRYFFITHTRDAAILDWVYEMGGWIAVILPLLVGMHRAAFKAWAADRP